MGEPLANYKAVVGAVRQLITPTPDGLGLSARGITVSTVGLVPRMQQLATEGIPLTLALSLHAPDDELRDELVPINTRWNVEEVIDAAWEYAKTTKRRVSIEYILIRDINDQPFRAELLAKVLRRRGNWGWVHVNLIPMNPTPGSVWTASRRMDEDEFVRRLQVRVCRSRCATRVAGRSTGLVGNLPHTRLSDGVTELDPTLYDLAEAFGVATEYWDWQGRHTSVTPDTVVAVLAALEIDASTPEAAAAALATHHRFPWTQMLPPCMTIREHRTASVWVHVPHGSPVTVWIELETGRVVTTRQLENWTRRVRSMRLGR